MPKGLSGRDLSCAEADRQVYAAKSTTWIVQPTMILCSMQVITTHNRTLPAEDSSDLLTLAKGAAVGALGVDRKKGIKDPQLLATCMGGMG